MKLGTLSLVLGAAMLAACAQGKPQLTTSVGTVSSVPAPAVGYWEGEVVASGGEFTAGSARPTMIVRKDRVEFTRHCADGTQAVTLKATSPARVAKDKIVIERTDVQAAPSGMPGCEARIDKGELPYVVRDGKLVLTLPGGSQIAFQRAVEPKTEAARADAPKGEKPLDLSKAGDDIAPGFSFRPLN